MVGATWPSAASTTEPNIVINAYSRNFANVQPIVSKWLYFRRGYCLELRDATTGWVNGSDYSSDAGFGGHGGPCFGRHCHSTSRAGHHDAVRRGCGRSLSG